MEGKTVILSMLIMSLVMAHNQVEANSCCPSTTASEKYKLCRFTGTPRRICGKVSGCIIVPETTCPQGYPYDIPEDSVNAVNEYCKLGCESSVCGALTTLQNYDESESEIVNGAVAQCTNTCSYFCTKGSAKAVEIA